MCLRLSVCRRQKGCSEIFSSLKVTQGHPPRTQTDGCSPSEPSVTWLAQKSSHPANGILLVRVWEDGGILVIMLRKSISLQLSCIPFKKKKKSGAKVKCDARVCVCVCGFASEISQSVKNVLNYNGSTHTCLSTPDIFQSRCGTNVLVLNSRISDAPCLTCSVSAPVQFLFTRFTSLSCHQALKLGWNLHLQAWVLFCGLPHRII